LGFFSVSIERSLLPRGFHLLREPLRFFGLPGGPHESPSFRWDSYSLFFMEFVAGEGGRGGKRCSPGQRPCSAGFLRAGLHPGIHQGELADDGLSCGPDSFGGILPQGGMAGSWIRKFYVPALWTLTVAFFRPGPSGHSLENDPSFQQPGHPDGLARSSRPRPGPARRAVLPGAHLHLRLGSQDRRRASILPSQHEPVYSRNLIGAHALAYDFWGVPRELEGKNALFVWTNVDP